MTHYRLPDWLGGVECELVTDHGNGRADVRTKGVTIELDFADLTKLGPQPVGAMVVDRDGDVWWRTAGGWSLHRGEEGSRDYASLTQDYGPLTHVIEDPAATAPELPWQGKDHNGYPVRISRDGDKLIFGSAYGPFPASVDLDTAEQGALAVLRAVREARSA